MAFFRRTPTVKRRADGDFDLTLDADRRDVLVSLLGQLRELLESQPDHPNLTRLHPPAYLDDQDADAAYQLLAGEELRDSQRRSIDAVIESLGRDRLTEDELWAWVQSLNGVRLVVGTRLDITEDDHGPSLRAAADPEDRSLWVVYDFTTQIQHDVVEALSGSIG
ncbi:MAG TPA: DUF2017 family protein [Acidimicrobiales bacterium]|nr:DUF2017 family protein [Acidimicrobiales bacterium]